MKLYEIAESYNSLDELEKNEEIIKYLDLIQDEFNKKSENIVKFIKNIEADSKALRDEEKRLADKRRGLENKVKGLKFYLQRNMEKLGNKKIKAGIFNLNIQKNPLSVNVVDEEKLGDDYFIIERKIDKAKLKEDLKKGKEIEGVELIQGESLRIR